MSFQGKKLGRNAPGHRDGGLGIVQSARRQTLRDARPAPPPRGASIADDFARVVAQELAVVRRRLDLRALRDEAPATVAAGRVPAEADRASAELGREVDLRAREMLLRRMRDLELAAARVTTGTYGRCETCGQAIPVARLRAFPQAALCISCQGAREGARSA
jgi:RNA polymerase-binding transcription factor